MRSIAAVLTMAVVLAAGDVLAQETADPDLEEAPAWTYSASAFTYLLPGESNYAQPTFMADREWLHLEGRYNYEALKTGSAWLGYNFSFGKSVAIELTPMIGGVFGDSSGIAPGYKALINWRAIEFSSESEYVFDLGDSSDSFFYTWSELGWAPAEWCRFGVAVQRTKVYETEFDIQRGFLVGLAFKGVNFTTYVFDPDATHPTVVLGVGVSF